MTYHPQRGHGQYLRAKKEILGIWLNSFSALTLFVWWQAGHLASKKTEWCWHGYLCGVRCRLAYGPADATATHSLLL